MVSNGTSTKYQGTILLFRSINLYWSTKVLIQSNNGTRHTIRSTIMLFAVVISPMRMAKSRTQMITIAVELHHGVVVQHKMITEPTSIYKIYYVLVTHLFSADALANSSSR